MLILLEIKNNNFLPIFQSMINVQIIKMEPRDLFTRGVWTTTNIKPSKIQKTNTFNYKGPNETFDLKWDSLLKY